MNIEFLIGNTVQGYIGLIPIIITLIVGLVFSVINYNKSDLYKIIGAFTFTILAVTLVGPILQNLLIFVSFNLNYLLYNQVGIVSLIGSFCLNLIYALGFIVFFIRAYKYIKRSESEEK